MKITDIEAITLKDSVGGKLEHYYCDTLIIRIYTDEGLVGISEVDSSPMVIKAIIDAPISSSRGSCSGLRKLLLGEDPLNIPQIWKKMTNGTRVFGISGAIFHAMSGIDIALWDLKGKATGKPISQLLGSNSSRPILAYASDIMPKKTEGAIDMVLNFQKMGFNAIKLAGGPLGGDVEQDADRVNTIRSAIGNELPLMIDLLMRWNKQTAILAAQRFDPFQLTWIEEPISCENPEDYGPICKKAKTPIAAGERLTSIFEFRVILEQGVKIVQPDLTRAGGFTGCLEIAHLAENYAAQCIPHIWSTSINLVAAIHLAGAISNCPWVEYCTRYTPLRREIITEPIQPQNGQLRAPTGPGLGLTLNEQIIRKFRV